MSNATNEKGVPLEGVGRRPLIEPAALAVIRGCYVEGNVVKLPPDKLEREVYEGVKAVLENLRGKWKGGRTQGFVFGSDPAPLLQLVQDTGEMPPKNPTAFFPTPAAVVAMIVKEIGDFVYLDGCRILEPSAGAGAICDGVKTAFDAHGTPHEIECVEFLEGNRERLREKGYRIVGEDFTLFSPNRPYDLIVMNPPFSLEGDSLAWLTHVERAWGMLAEDGRLVAIIPPALRHRDSRRIEAFRDLANLHGYAEDIPAGAFKESATGVATIILTMTKQDQSWRDREWQGWPNWHCWYASLATDNDRQLSDARVKAFAKGPDAMKVHFERVAAAARKAGDPCRLTDADHACLYRHYADEDEAPAMTLVANPSLENEADASLGGLFQVAA